MFQKEKKNWKGIYFYFPQVQNILHIFLRKKRSGYLHYENSSEDRFESAHDLQFDLLK